MPITDPFTGANGDAPGPGWTNQSGGAWEIFNNGIRPTDDFSTSLLIRTEASFPNDQYAQVKIKYSSAVSDFPLNQVSCRVDGSGNGYNVVFDGNGVTLTRGAAGTYITDTAIGGTSANTFYLVKIEAAGTTIKVFVDTGGGLVERISVTDATYSSGKPAIRSVTGSVANMLEFEDFECSDASGQVVGPDADISNAGAWTTSPLFQKVDETAASDADFISSPSAPSNAACVLGLADVTDPAVNTGHKLRVRYRKAAGGSHRMDLVYRLLQGASEIAAWTATDIGTAFTTVEQTLSGTQADAITNYADLRVELSANKVTTNAPAPTFVAAGAGAASATSGAAIAPGLPTGWAANDIHFMVAHVSANTDFTDPSGWTRISSLVGNNTTAQRVVCWWRRAVSGDTAPSISMASASTAVRAARIFGIRGCPTTGDPWDVLSFLANAASATISTTSIDTTAVNTLVMFVGCYEDDPTAATDPSGYSTDLRYGTTLGNDAAIFEWHKTLSATGAENPSSTVSGGTFTNSPNVGIMIAFKGNPLVDTTADVSFVQFEAPDAPAGGSQTLAAVVAGLSDAAGNLTVAKPVAAQANAVSAVSGALALSLPIAAAVAGQSTAVANIGVNYAISSAIAGQSVVDANLLATINLRGQVDAVCGVAASFNLAISLSAAPAGQSTADAVAAVVRGLQSVVAGQSAPSADLVVAMPLAAVVDGQSTAAADLRPSRGIAAQVDGASSIAAAVAITRGIAAQSDAVSAVASNVVISHPLAAACGASGNIAGDLRVDGGFAATIAAQSSVAAALAVAFSLAAAVVGQSDAAAAATMARGLAGNVAGQSAVAVNAIASYSIAGTVAAFSVVTAALDGTAAPIGIAAQVDGASSAAGAIAVSFSLSSSVAGQSATDSHLSVNRGLSAAVASTAAVLGEVAVARSVATATAGQAAISGNLIASYSIASACDAVSTVSPSLAVARPIATACAAQSTMSGALINVVTLSATIAAASSVSGAARNAVRLTAQADGLVTIAARLQQDAKLQAIAAAVASNAGALRVDFKIGAAIAGQSAVAANLELILTQSEFLIPHQRIFRPGIGSTNAGDTRVGNSRTIKPGTGNKKVF